MRGFRLEAASKEAFGRVLSSFYLREPLWAHMWRHVLEPLARFPLHIPAHLLFGSESFHSCHPSSVDSRRRLAASPLPPAAKGNRTKDQAEREISATELNMLPCLYPWSINVVVYHDPSGRSHLGRGLALRCFQRLSFPDVATQQCR